MEKTKIGIQEAAKILLLSPCRVRELARAGIIKSYKVYPGAKKRFFYKEELESYRVSGAD